MSIAIKHPKYGAGTCTEYENGRFFFKFPGCFGIWQEVTPAEAILDFHSVQLLTLLLGDLPASLSELIWKTYRGQAR